MGLIGSMAVAIIGDISGLDSSLKKAKKDLKQFNKDVDQIATGISDAGKKLTTRLTLPILGAGAASFKMAADMEDAIGATDQIFKDASDSMKSWANGLESYYGIAESEALEYGNMMGSMLQNIGGLTEDEAAKQAQTLIRLAGDLTAMYGGTTEDAIRALTGSLKGNNTMLDNYGMAVNDAMVKTKAFEMGIYDGTGQMDLAAKQAATLALIMEQTGAAQGQAAREAGGASGSMRALVTEAKNLAISFGTILLPIITPMIAKVNELMQKFSNLSPTIQGNIVKIAAIAAAVGPALVVLGSLISVVGGVIGSFGAMGLAIKGGATGLGVLTTAFPALGTAITVLTGPVGIITAAIIGIGLVVMDLWRTNEDFRNGVIKIWDDIKGSFNAFVDFAKGLWDAWGKYFIIYGKAVWESLKTIISAALRIIGEIIAFAMNVITLDFDGAWENIKNIFKIGAEAIKGVVNTMATALKEIFLGLVKDALEWGKNLIGSFIAGLKSGFVDLRDAASNAAKIVADFIGFGSPTKKGPGRFVENWGANMLKSFYAGMDKQFASFQSSLSNVAAGLNPALAGATNNTYGGNNYITINVNGGNWSDIERELNRRGVRL